MVPKPAKILFRVKIQFRYNLSEDIKVKFKNKKCYILLFNRFIIELLISYNNSRFVTLFIRKVSREYSKF